MLEFEGEVVVTRVVVAVVMAPVVDVVVVARSLVDWLEEALEAVVAFVLVVVSGETVSPATSVPELSVVVVAVSVSIWMVSVVGSVEATAGSMEGREVAGAGVARLQPSQIPGVPRSVASGLMF